MAFQQQNIVSTLAASMASQRAEQLKKSRERPHGELKTERNQHQPATQTHLVVPIFRPGSQQAATETGALAAIGTGTQTKQGIVTEPFTP